MSVIHTPADFLEALGLPITVLPEFCEELVNREKAAKVAYDVQQQRLAGAPGSDRIPLLDEDGEEFGRVEARIPAALFFNMEQRYGQEAWSEDSDLLKYALREHPQFRVNTVQPFGRVVTGYRGAARTVVKRYA